MQYITSSPEETQALAQTLLSTHSDQIWFLKGDLGAGKTTFVKGVGQALGLQSEEVKSPTFALVHSYPTWAHYDLYRLENQDPYILELIEEDFAAGKRLFIEWPQRLEALSHYPNLCLEFTTQPDGTRKIELMP